MSRNLIVCFDGTNNQFGTHDTNVVRLVQSLERFSGQQVVYYDPGVGTLPEPALPTRAAKRVSEIFGLAFAWLLDAAKQAGLATDPEREQRVLTRSPPPDKPWAEPQHESLTWPWWPAELFPKLRYNKRLGRRLPSLGLGRRRRIEAQAQLHRSVLQRMESLGSYSPPNLSSRSLERARNVFSPARPPSS